MTTVAAGTALCASMMGAPTAVPGFEAKARRHALRQSADPAAGRYDVAWQLVSKIAEPGMERGQELSGRKPVVPIPEAFVPGRAGVADECARQLRRDPVAGLDESGGRLEDGRILFENLQDLREQPLRRGASAVVAQERLAPRRREIVDAIRLRLRRVVLPQLDPCVRMRRPGRRQRQRLTAAIDRQNRARGEVDADADHLRRIRRGPRQARRRPPAASTRGNRRDAAAPSPRRVAPANRAASARSRRAGIRRH